MMKSGIERSVFVSVLLPLALFIMTGSCGLFSQLANSIDLSPFREMAKNDLCANVRNRLFVIDNQWVFWDTEGSCADASYSEILFGSTPDQILCSAHDSIAGPMKSCQDNTVQDIFETIIANLDKPDLGLGSEHIVEPVSF